MPLFRVTLIFLFAASIVAEPCNPYRMLTGMTIYKEPCDSIWTTHLQDNALSVVLVQPKCKGEILTAEMALPSSSYFLGYPVQLADVTSLEYNTRWSQPMTNCTFGIGDEIGFFLNMTDQLGLTNNPNEDLKFSNGWYSRRFVLDGPTINANSGTSGLRFGFICSRNDVNETLFRNFQFNRIRVFRGQSDLEGIDLMDPQQMCTECIQPLPYYGMQCQRDGNVDSWVQKGDYRHKQLQVSSFQNVKVLGDVYSQYISIADDAKLNITGCLKSQGYVINVELSGYYRTQNSLTIYTGQNCSLPSIRIGDGNWNSRCPDYVEGEAYISGSNSITFKWWRTADIQCQRNEDEVEWQLILVIVLPCCAVIAGVIIAIVFGVRKHKKRQMERQEKLEEMTRSSLKINPKNDIEK